MGTLMQAFSTIELADRDPRITCLLLIARINVRGGVEEALSTEEKACPGAQIERQTQCPN